MGMVPLALTGFLTPQGPGPGYGTHMGAFKAGPVSRSWPRFPLALSRPWGLSSSAIVYFVKLPFRFEIPLRLEFVRTEGIINFKL
jgi:hypothetical protein